MSDTFSLVLQVQGAEQLVRLEGLIKGLGTAGKGAEKDLASAAAQTKAITEGFGKLAAQFKDSFGQLAASVKTLGTALDSLQQKARPTAGGQSAARKLKVDADEATISAQKLRAALQAAYDTELVGASRGVGRGRQRLEGTDLRYLKAQGVNLTPEDKVRLKVFDDEFKAVATQGRLLVAEQKRIQDGGRAHVAALRENAFREKAVQDLVRSQGLTEVAARTENSARIEQAQKRVQEMGRVHAAALRENATLEAAALASARREGLTEVAARTEGAKRTAQELKRVQDMGRVHAAALKENAAREKAVQAQVRTQGLAEVAARAEQATRLEQAQKQIQNIGKAHVAALKENADREAQVQAEAQKRGRVEAEAAAENATRAAAAVERVRQQRVANARFEGEGAGALVRRSAQARSFISQGGSRGDAEEQYGTRAVNEAGRARGAFASLKQTMDEHRAGVGATDKAYHTLHTTARGAAGAMGAIWLTWGQPMAALWAGFAIAGSIKVAITQAMSFNAELGRMAALSGASAEQVERLSKSTLELARNSTSTPIELAKGLKILSQTGMKPEQAERALPDVQKFAALGEMDLDKASETLIGISAAFSVPTASIRYTGDVIAKAAALSQSSISSITEAMKTASVVAEQYGAEITEVTSILALLSQRNIQNSTAGTAVRNMYKELYTPSTKGQKLFDQIGFSAFDKMTGKAKTATEALKELSVLFQRFSPQGKLEAFDTIFGERGGKAGSAVFSGMPTLANFQDELRGNNPLKPNVPGASGFVDTATDRTLKDLESKAKLASNAFSAALNEAGKAASPALEALALQLQNLFNSEGFRSGLTTLLTGFADLVKAVVENGREIATFGAVYLGIRLAGGVATAIGGLTQLGGSVLKTRAEIAVLNAELLRNQAAMKVAETATLATAAANATKAGTLATVVGGVGTAISMFGRFLPVLGLVITGLQLAALAWEVFGKKRNEAMKEDGPPVKSDFDKAMERSKSVLEKSSAAVTDFEPGQNVGYTIREIDGEVRRLEATRRTVQTELQALATAKAGPGGTLGVVAASDIVKAQQLGVKYGELSKRIEDLKGNRGVLGEGVRPSPYPDATGRPSTDDGKGRGSYADPVGTEISSILGKRKAQFEATKKVFDGEQAFIEAYHRAGLIGEESYTADIEALAARRTRSLVSEAEDNILLLPAEKDKRRQSIIERSGKDPKRYAAEMRALNAEFDKKAADFAIALDQAIAEAERINGLAKIAVEGRAVGAEKALQDLIGAARTRDEVRVQERTDAVENLEESLGLKEQLRLLKDSFTAASDLEIAYGEERYRIERGYLKLRNDARKASDTDWLAQINASEQQALAMAAERAALQKAKSQDPAVGVQVAARKQLGELENVAERSAEVFTNAMKSSEEALVQFVTTGKMDFRSLVNSILADMARLAIQQELTKPLLKGLMGMFGGGAAPGAAGSLDVFSGMGGATIATAMGHSGGLVGSLPGTKFDVPASMFHGAMRYHSGGPILKADEVPIIARKGERMLTESQNRAYEQGSGGGVTIVNHNTFGTQISRGEIATALMQNQKATKASIADSMRRGRNSFR